MWIFTPDAGVSASDGLDRGLQFGDGLFETMRLQGGNIEAFNRHMARLESGIERLALPSIDHLAACILQATDDLMRCAQADTGVLKLIYTRGVGGRGYLPGTSAAYWYLSLSELPAVSVNELTLGIAQTQAGIQRQLAGLKHLNRLENVLARMECEFLGCDEVLMLNAFDEVIEASAHNIFMVIEGRLYTPSLQHSGVQGVMRGRILDFCQAQGIDCQESSIGRNLLPHIEAAMLSNSIFGPRLVKSLDGKSLPDHPLINVIIRAHASGILNE